MTRYQVRYASTLNTYAVFDTETLELCPISPLSDDTFIKDVAVAHAQYLNDAEARFQASEHTAESFARLIRSTVR